MEEKKTSASRSFRYGRNLWRSSSDAYLFPWLGAAVGGAYLGVQSVEYGDMFYLLGSAAIGAEMGFAMATLAICGFYAMAMIWWPAVYLSRKLSSQFR